MDFEICSLRATGEPLSVNSQIYPQATEKNQNVNTNHHDAWARRSKGAQLAVVHYTILSHNHVCYNSSLILPALGLPPTPERVTQLKTYLGVIPNWKDNP